MLTHAKQANAALGIVYSVPKAFSLKRMQNDCLNFVPLKNLLLPAGKLAPIHDRSLALRNLYSAGGAKVPPKPDVHHTWTSTGLARNWNCKPSYENAALAGDKYLYTFAQCLADAALCRHICTRCPVRSVLARNASRWHRDVGF
jgi:hypothetical protein